MQINGHLPALYQAAVPAATTTGNTPTPVRSTPARAGTPSITAYTTPGAGQGQDYARLSPQGGGLSPTARRALTAYSENANQEQRSYLTRTLGIDVYA